MTARECDSRECPLLPTRHITERGTDRQWWTCDAHVREVVFNADGPVIVAVMAVRDKDWP